MRAMNYARIALAAVAATVADFIYGFVVYGTLLDASFAAHPGVYRQAETQMTYMPIGAAGIFLAMLAASTIYSKGYEGGRGVREGARFGLLLALFVIGGFVLVNHATIALAAGHSARMAAAALGEWILVGATIGLVYTPAAAGSVKGRIPV
jgi:hypothetical protein